MKIATGYGSSYQLRPDDIASLKNREDFEALFELIRLDQQSYVILGDLYSRAMTLGLRGQMERNDVKSLGQKLLQQMKA